MSDRQPDNTQRVTPPARDMRTGLHRLFSGESRIGSRRLSPESPKTPRLPLGFPNISSSRITLPHLTHTRSNRSIDSQTSISPLSPHVAPPAHSRTISAESFRELQRSASDTAADRRRDSRRRFVGVDPEELHLAHLAEAHRARKNKHKNKKRQRQPICLPNIKNRTIRKKLLSCVVSGSILFFVLGICKALPPTSLIAVEANNGTIDLTISLTKKDADSEFNVLLILFMLATGIVFCHSVIRLAMMIRHPPPEGERRRRNLPPMVGPGGFANPPEPIRVVLARDEEAVGIESEALKFPPPAYGLWRESVVSTCYVNFTLVLLRC